LESHIKLVGGQVKTRALLPARAVEAVLPAY
jgi:hypothetical protein